MSVLNFSFFRSNYQFPKMPAFTAGEILKNKEKWSDAMVWMESNGGFVPPLLKDAINSGFFDLRHKSFTNFNAKKVVFRGVNFSSKEELLADLAI